REIIAKCLTGLMAVTGWSQAGIASIGVVAPDSRARGGLVKKPINCACCCVRVNVAIIIPSPIPQSTHSEAERKNKSKLPRTGTPKTTRATPSASPMSIESSRKMGATLAMMISELLDGADFFLTHQRSRRNDRALQHQEQSDHPGGNEPGALQSRIVEQRQVRHDRSSRRRICRHRDRATRGIWVANLLAARLRHRNLLIETRDDARGVSAGDRGGVGVDRIH